MSQVLSYVVFHAILNLRNDGHQLSAGPCRRDVLHQRFGIIGCIIRGRGVDFGIQCATKGVDGTLAYFSVLFNVRVIRQLRVAVEYFRDEVADPVSLVYVLRWKVVNHSELIPNM